MKRGHAAIALVVLAVALVSGFLLFRGTITGRQISIPMRIIPLEEVSREAPSAERVVLPPAEEQPPETMRAVLPRDKPRAKTEAEWCISLYIPENDKSLQGCETDKVNCLKTHGAESCNYAHMNCKIQHLAYFAYSVKKCMKNMGVLL